MSRRRLSENALFAPFHVARLKQILNVQKGEIETSSMADRAMKRLEESHGLAKEQVKLQGRSYRELRRQIPLTNLEGWESEVNWERVLYGPWPDENE